MSAALLAAPAAQAAAAPASDATATLAGGELRYSTVWEDHRLLERGLAHVTGNDLLVVASAGCNVLNLLRLAPRRVVALDVNPAQTALLALKLATLRALRHDEMVALLGAVAPGGDGDVDDAACDDAGAGRLALYERVRPLLGDEARGWWDAHPDLLAAGASGAGRLDRYIAGFRRDVLARHCDRATVARILATDDPTARRRLAAAALFTPGFAADFRAYFGRSALAARGRCAAQFRHVPAPVDVGGWFLRRLHWAVTALPTRGNGYLARFLLGAPQDADQGPPWMRRAAFARLRALAPRVEVVTEALEPFLAAQPGRALGGAALSDVFEYLPADTSDALFGELARVLRPGARLAYWNLFVARESPEALRARLRPLAPLARALWRRDRAWFYGAFRVEERAGGPAGGAA